MYSPDLFRFILCSLILQANADAPREVLTKGWTNENRSIADSIQSHPENAYREQIVDGQGSPPYHVYGCNLLSDYVFLRIEQIPIFSCAYRDLRAMVVLICGMQRLKFVWTKTRLHKVVFDEVRLLFCSCIPLAQHILVRQCWTVDSVLLVHGVADYALECLLRKILMQAQRTTRCQTFPDATGERFGRLSWRVLWQRLKNASERPTVRGTGHIR